MPLEDIEKGVTTLPSPRLANCPGQKACQSSCQLLDIFPRISVLKPGSESSFPTGEADDPLRPLLALHVGDEV